MADEEGEADPADGPPAPDLFELRRRVEARLVRLDDPEQPVAVEVAVARQPLDLGGDPRLRRRVPDRDPPRPGQQRRLDRLGLKRAARGDVVERQAAEGDRPVPEDRVADEAVRRAAAASRLSSSAGRGRGRSGARRSPRSRSPSTTATGTGSGSAGCRRSASRRDRPRASCRAGPARRSRRREPASRSGGAVDAASAGAGLDPPAPVGALEGLGGVEQELVAAPGRLELEADRQPVGAEPDRGVDRRGPGQVGEGAAADVGLVGGLGARRQLDDRRGERRRRRRDGRPGEDVDLLEERREPAPRQRPDPVGLGDGDRRDQHPVPGDVAVDQADLGAHPVELGGGDAAEPVGVGDQDRRDRRLRQVRQGDLRDRAAGLLAERPRSPSRRPPRPRGRRPRRGRRGSPRSAGRRRRPARGPRRTGPRPAGGSRRRRRRAGRRRSSSSSGRRGGRPSPSGRRSASARSGRSRRRDSGPSRGRRRRPRRRRAAPATEAAGPLEDPPGQRSVSQGLWAGP